MRARVSRQMASAGQTSSANTPDIGWPVWRLAWIIVFGAFAAGMDASLANIGLETIATDLDSSLERVQWVSNGYLLALRSEERRVGKECRSWWGPDDWKKKET